MTLRLIVLLAVASCTDSVVELGVVEFSGSQAHIEAPTSVDAGVTFNVRVWTSGNDCYSYASTKVVTEGSSTVILPYDRRLEADVCAQIIVNIPHDVSLKYDASGTETILVRCRRRGDDSVIDIPISIIVN